MKRVTITVENTENNEMETVVIMTNEDVTVAELKALTSDFVGGRPNDRR